MVQPQCTELTKVHFTFKMTYSFAVNKIPFTTVSAALPYRFSLNSRNYATTVSADLSQQNFHSNRNETCKVRQARKFTDGSK